MWPIAPTPLGVKLSSPKLFHPSSDWNYRNFFIFMNILPCGRDSAILSNAVCMTKGFNMNGEMKYFSSGPNYLTHCHGNLGGLKLLSSAQAEKGENDTQQESVMGMGKTGIPCQNCSGVVKTTMQLTVKHGERSLNLEVELDELVFQTLFHYTTQIFSQTPENILWIYVQILQSPLETLLYRRWFKSLQGSDPPWLNCNK